MQGRSIEGITTAYDDADMRHAVSLAAEPGRIAGTLGPNGSGKTTLNRSMLRLTRPRHGTIRFDGSVLSTLETHQIAACGIACVPEGKRVFPKMTGEENLRLGASTERDAAAIPARIEPVYGIFRRLRKRAAHAAGTVSGASRRWSPLAGA